MRIQKGVDLIARCDRDERVRSEEYSPMNLSQNQSNFGSGVFHLKKLPAFHNFTILLFIINNITLHYQTRFVFCQKFCSLPRFSAPCSKVRSYFCQLLSILLLFGISTNFRCDILYLRCCNGTKCTNYKTKTFCFGKCCYDS